MYFSHSRPSTSEKNKKIAWPSRELAFRAYPSCERVLAVLVSPVMTFQGNRPTVSSGSAFSTLPLAVQQLASREREIATIVHIHGAATAKEVEAELRPPLSNSAVRVMLSRLVEKGILTRCGGRKGGGSREAIYLPAGSAGKLRQRALKELSDQYFDGSLLDVAATALRILKTRA